MLLGKTRDRRAGVLRLALSGLSMAFALQWAPASAQELRIEHVTLVSPERPDALQNATVTVHEGRITAISTKSSGSDAAMRAAGAAILDGHRLYLTPGLIDSHVHLSFIPGMTDEQEHAHPDVAQAAR